MSSLSLDTQTNLPESHNETTSFLQSAFLNFDVQYSGRSEKAIQHQPQTYPPDLIFMGQIGNAF